MASEGCGDGGGGSGEGGSQPGGRRPKDDEKWMNMWNTSRCYFCRFCDSIFVTENAVKWHLKLRHGGGGGGSAESPSSGSAPMELYYTLDGCSARGGSRSPFRRRRQSSSSKTKHDKGPPAAGGNSLGADNQGGDAEGAGNNTPTASTSAATASGQNEPAVTIKSEPVSPSAARNDNDDEACQDPGEGPSTRPCQCSRCRPSPPDASEVIVDKFLNNTHAMLESLREKKDKERTIGQAEKLQERAWASTKALAQLKENSESDCAALTRQIEETERKIRKLQVIQENRRERLKRIREEASEGQVTIEKRLRSIWDDPQFLDVDELARLKEELQQMTDASSSLKGALNLAPFEESDVSKTVQCPICFEIPKGRVFSCQQCSNLLCQDCMASPRVTQCPSCREDFASKPAMRNILAERIIASLYKQELH